MRDGGSAAHPLSPQVWTRRPPCPCFLHVGIRGPTSHLLSVPECPRWRAAAHGQSAIVEVLRKAGANSRDVDDAQRNALYYALRGGDEAMIRELACDGWSLGNLKPSDSEGGPLHIVARYNSRTRVLEWLLKDQSAACCCEVNASGGPQGSTALHVAALWGQAEAVCLLLHYGADPSVTDREGRTPLQVAESCEVKEILQVKAPSPLKPRAVECRPESPPPRQAVPPSLGNP